MTYQQSCKKCLSVIDKNHQVILKSLDTSKNLKHLDTSLLERRITELQASSQVGTASMEEEHHVLFTRMSFIANFGSLVNLSIV